MFRVHQKLIRRAVVNQTRSRHTSQDVRRLFIEYFKTQHDHLFVPSSSVIPQRKGEGTYFTNAGMNQFKPLFLGAVPPGSLMADYKRVVNSQKCIRVGGKHNDLDDVGHDLSHHTFFEMLGNWSFGDYFKKQSCEMALGLLTDVYQLPRDRLYFTYFNGDTTLNLPPDLETKTIWLELGIPEDQILPFGMKDNFWDMGDAGPCGPCTEIHYDHIGNGGEAKLVNMDSSDVVEIWNLVFMQYNRQPDQCLRPLANHHVDTGMGLERLTAVLKGSKSNYDTDLFSPLFETIHNMSGSPEYGGKVGQEDVNGLDTAYRILADHSRMLTVAIADGLIPSREDLGSKLRQIINRALQQTHDVFNSDTSLLVSLVDQVSNSLGESYPEIPENLSKIKEVVLKTGEVYQENKQKAVKCFNKMLNKYGDDIKTISGEMAFEIFEGRYGANIPIDMIQDIAQGRNMAIDMEGLNAILQKVKEKSSQSVNQQKCQLLLSNDVMDRLRADDITTDDSYKYRYTKEDVSYKHRYMVQKEVYIYDQPNDVEVSAIIHQDDLTDSLEAGQTGYVILDKTHFYSEAGGQIGDRGEISTQTGKGEVTDVQNYQNYILHQVKVTEGQINVKDICNLVLDEEHRLGCMQNHTATHLLNATLQVLVDAKQNDSVIQPNKFTFDFTSMSSLSLEDIKNIEEIVQGHIKVNSKVRREELTLEEAMKIPEVEAMTFLKNDLPDRIFVVSIGEDYSLSELCCGTHVVNTTDLEHFCIIKLSGVSQGTKGLTCVTGQLAVQAGKNEQQLQESYEQLEQLVETGQDPESWSASVRDINKLCNLELLPKFSRDSYQMKTDQLHSIIRSKLNQIKVDSLTKQAKEALNNTRKISAAEISTSDVKFVLKAVKNVSLKQPLILYSNANKKISIFLTLPKDMVPDNFHESLSGSVPGEHILCKDVQDCQLFHWTFKSVPSSQALTEIQDCVNSFFVET